MKLLRLQAKEGVLVEVSRLIYAHLNLADFFAVALVGELGAGKTSLARQIFYTLGLEKTHPVLSPTFSYIHDYQVNGKLYAHLDLYRCEAKVRLEDFLAYDYFDYRGLLIEWPERLAQSEQRLFTHKLTISNVEGELDSRLYELELVENEGAI